MLHRTLFRAVCLSLLLVPCLAQMPRAQTGDDAALAPRPAVMARLADQSLLLDVARAGERLVAVGARGVILTSDDDGKSWTQRPVPVRAALTAVSFADERTGWAVGHDAVILKTEDAGETWALQYRDPQAEEPLLLVDFTSARDGIAMGAYGLYLETADGGESWTRRAIIEDEYHYYGVARPGGQDSGRIVGAGEFGMVLASGDGGENWDLLNSPYEGSFFGIHALDDSTGDDGDLLVFGLRGHLFRSDDAGMSWEEIETGTVAGLMDAVTLSDGRVVVAGLSGTILVSDDGGRSFSLIQRPGREKLSAVTETSDGALLLLGDMGAVRTRLPEAGTTGAMTGAMEDEAK